MPSEELSDVTPHCCTECGSYNTEDIETEKTTAGEFIRRRSCGDCYAGYEVRYQAVSTETYHEPEVPGQ